MSRYTVLLYPAESGGFVAMIPMFGLATEGETVEHALAMAREAVELRIESLVNDGEPVLEEEQEPIVAAIHVEIPIPVAPTR
jgi:predicted RNase H-like HicB family nuclease